MLSTYSTDIIAIRMSKLPSLPSESLPKIQTTLGQLYRRHQVLTRLIRALEGCAPMSRTPCLAGLSPHGHTASQHVN